MEDYVRLYLNQIVGVIVALVVILVAATFTKRYVPDEQKAINTGRNVLVFLVLFGFGLYLFTSGSVMVTPRKVIDRSETTKQQREFEQRHTKEKEGR